MNFEGPALELCAHVPELNRLVSAVEHDNGLSLPTEFITDKVSNFLTEGFLKSGIFNHRTLLTTFVL